MPPKNRAGLPPNTKLDGHRRARLLTELGEEEADVVVRHDLADADRATVDMVFYDFALGRRNSHPIDLARMVIRKYELEKGRPRGGLKRHDEAEARDRVGKKPTATGSTNGSTRKAAHTNHAPANGTPVPINRINGAHNGHRMAHLLDTLAVGADG
jgi:hypothetical protein